MYAKLTAIRGWSSASLDRQGVADDLEGGAGVVHGEQDWDAPHRHWVTLAERNGAGLQRSAAERVALVEDLRRSPNTSTDRPMAELLREHPACSKVTPTALAVMCPALPPLRVAALACAVAAPRRRGGWLT
jgi:hypothetical protein